MSVTLLLLLHLTIHSTQHLGRHLADYTIKVTGNHVMYDRGA